MLDLQDPATIANHDEDLAITDDSVQAGRLEGGQRRKP